uniref:UBA domain-containing protein n=1 Tax=Macaca fascicularis TaxID=9541 RepID=A0A7N9IA54_MACFA
MRLAQVIFDKNDSDFEAKVKQLMEVTGKNQDECIVALHDCNGDVNKAINILLEGNSDTTSWETVGGKKKILQRKFRNKENRRKKAEEWAWKQQPRGKGRGVIVAENVIRGEENGIDCNQVDKPSDACGEYSSVAQDLSNKSSYGLKGAWKNSVEEWTTEDWTEDVSVCCQMRLFFLFLFSFFLFLFFFFLRWNFAFVAQARVQWRELRLIATSASWIQAILLPHPPK